LAPFYPIVGNWRCRRELTMRPWWGLAAALASWRIARRPKGAHVGGAMSNYQDLIITSESGVATVAINRPKPEFRKHVR